MIIGMTGCFGGDISRLFHKSPRHILFPISKEGKRGDKDGEGALDQECVSIIGCRFGIKLPDGIALYKRGPKDFGEVILYKIEEKTFHALVCYSNHEEGWGNTPKIIKEYLDSLVLPDPDKEIISFIMDNDETELKLGGIDLIEILEVIAGSNKRIEVYLL